MLDRESHQIREVFAQFGLAMYLAQCVEQAIFVNLMFLDHFPKAYGSVSSTEEWVERYEEFESRELRKTMGMLIRRFKEVGETDEIEILLADVLKRRNFLAHQFFVDRAVELTLEDGRTTMIAELQQYQELFEEAENQVNAMSKPVAEKYGFNDEVLEAAKKSMVAEYQSQNMGEQDVPPKSDRAGG